MAATCIGRILGQIYGPLLCILAALFTSLLPTVLGAQAITVMERVFLMPTGAFDIPNAEVTVSRLLVVGLSLICLTVFCVAFATMYMRRGQPGQRRRAWLTAASTVMFLASSVATYATPSTVARDPHVAVCVPYDGGEQQTEICVWPEHREDLDLYARYAPTIARLYVHAGLEMPNFAEPGIDDTSESLFSYGYSSEYSRATSMLLPITGMGLSKCDKASTEEIDTAFKWGLTQMLGDDAAQYVAPDSALGELAGMTDAEMEEWLSRRMPDLEWCAKRDIAYTTPVNDLNS